jgi:hypothetical protein
MRALVASTLVLNALLLVSLAGMGAAIASQGEGGIWVVVLFYALVIVAPIVSITTVGLQARRLAAQSTASEPGGSN